MIRGLNWRRLIAATGLASLALTGPVAASETALHAAPGPIKPVLKDSSALVQIQEEAQRARAPFLRTKKGLFAAALMVAGSAFVVYSKSHDRVHSPGRN